MQLLSTKFLEYHFKTRILALGYALVEYPFIRKNTLDYHAKEWGENWIFTSAYAAKTALNSPKISPEFKNKRLFCVGKKTAQLFRDRRLNIVAIENNARALAEKIIATEQAKTFSFFCGQKRRPEIETLLTEKGIKVAIHELYATVLTPKLFETAFDGILFFSPSAVESFIQKNNLEKQYAFCIGATTAAEAAKYTQKIYAAKTPDENSLLVELKRHMQSYAKE